MVSQVRYLKTKLPNTLPPMRIKEQLMEALYRMQQYANKYIVLKNELLQRTDIHKSKRGNRKYNGRP